MCSSGRACVFLAFGLYNKQPVAVLIWWIVSCTFTHRPLQQSQSVLPGLLLLLSGSLLLQSLWARAERTGQWAGCPSTRTSLPHFLVGWTETQLWAWYLPESIEGRLVCQVDSAVAISPGESPLQSTLKTNPAVLLPKPSHLSPGCIVFSSLEGQPAL